MADSSLLAKEILEAQNSKNKAAAQRVVNAYHRVFGGTRDENPDGHLVLADLKLCFGVDLPEWLPIQTKDGVRYDKFHAAIRSGQRQVLLHIDTKLRIEPKGDANVEGQEKVKVITE